MYSSLTSFLEDNDAKMYDRDDLYFFEHDDWGDRD